MSEPAFSVGRYGGSYSITRELVRMPRVLWGGRMLPFGRRPVQVGSPEDRGSNFSAFLKGAVRARMLSDYRPIAKQWGLYLATDESVAAGFAVMGALFDDVWPEPTLITITRG